MGETKADERKKLEEDVIKKIEELKREREEKKLKKQKELERLKEREALRDNLIKKYNEIQDELNRIEAEMNQK